MVFSRALSLFLTILTAVMLAGCPKTSSPANETQASPDEEVWYTGSESCRNCHAEAHASWAKTWMARTVRAPSSADLSLIENSILCGGMDVDYVLGGRLTLRYMQKREGDIVFLPCEYDAVGKQVNPFHLDDWQSFSFVEKCAVCHTTGFDVEKRDWVEVGVGCESCHGPASRHGDYQTKGRTISYKQISPNEENMICSSCHLQGGFSTKSDRRFPEGYVPGMDLFDIYRFPWETLQPPGEQEGEDTPANPVDVHQKILMKHTLDGESDLRCTNCHEVHQAKHDKHKELPREDFCYHCHKLEDGKFGLKDYEVECPVCEF